MQIFMTVLAWLRFSIVRSGKRTKGVTVTQMTENYVYVKKLHVQNYTNISLIKDMLMK